MPLETTAGTSSASRKIRRLGIAVVIVVALYSVGWFFVASKIEGIVGDFIARPGPVKIECDGLERMGTPFRIGFACNRTGIKDDIDGSMVSGGALRAVANIYNPGSALVELDGPVDASFLDGTVVNADWSLLRSGFSIGLSGLKTLSVTSEGISADLFHKIVAGAGIDAGVDAALVARLEAAPDHPTTLIFPEGEYLKGLALLRRT